jgi:hypothetical protein
MELTKAEVAMLKLAYSPAYLKMYKILSYCFIVLAIALAIESVNTSITFQNTDEVISKMNEMIVHFNVVLCGMFISVSLFFHSQYRAANLIRKLTENKTENKNA